MNDSPEELMSEQELRDKLAHRERAYKLACENLADMSKNRQELTDALLAAIRLIDQLLSEVGRLCAASNEPPPISIFAAKKSFDQRMSQLLKEESHD